MTARVRRGFVDGPLGQLHLRSAAPAAPVRDPLVCLHMSPKSSWMFRDILPHLALERMALAPDYPGHGESDLPPADPPVTIGDFARSVWAVIDAHTDGPVHLLGSHTGAMVAVEAATQRPQRVRSIVSLSAPVFTPDEIAAFRAAYAPIPLDEAGTRFTTLWARVLEHRGPGMPLTLCAESFAENLRAGDAYEWGHRAAFDYAPLYPERLRGIRAPVLVINAGDDLHDHTLRADALLHDGRRIERPDWAHGYLSVHAREAADLVTRFCNDAEAR